jgi:hypothetical protein
MTLNLEEKNIGHATQRKHMHPSHCDAALAIAACHSLLFLFTCPEREGGEDTLDPEVGCRGRSSFCSLHGAAGRGGSVLSKERGVGMSARTGQGPGRPCATPCIGFESYHCLACQIGMLYSFVIRNVCSPDVR